MDLPALKRISTGWFQEYRPFPVSFLAKVSFLKNSDE